MTHFKSRAEWQDMPSFGQEGMTGAEHILYWIESSREHYDRLLLIARDKQTARHSTIATRAALLASDAYREMTRGGDAYTSDHSPRSILEAAILLTEWELEQ